MSDIIHNHPIGWGIEGIGIGTPSEDDFNNLTKLGFKGKSGLYIPDGPIFWQYNQAIFKGISYDYYWKLYGIP